jgi:hypothetical protein
MCLKLPSYYNLIEDALVLQYYKLIFSSLKITKKKEFRPSIPTISWIKENKFMLTQKLILLNIKIFGPFLVFMLVLQNTHKPNKPYYSIFWTF